MDVKTGVAHGLATKALDPPNRNVRIIAPAWLFPFCCIPSLFSVGSMVPLPSSKISDEDCEDLFDCSRGRSNSKDGNGKLTKFNSCNPMTRQTPEDNAATTNSPKPPESPPPTPLLPKTPPTDAAISPRVQNTEANPAANATVGMRACLSSRSPAAVEIYDTVSGSSPQTHGLTEVNNPAPYMTGKDFHIDVGSFNDREAKLEAALSALYKSVSKSKPIVMAEEEEDGGFR
mmetsp:Transcript_24409/g.34407  ORF Transcript_24409/g.34407 Transcript_24409/m.34407 type:complete len:231 (-) Transcript_24409:402-1094(-)